MRLFLLTSDAPDLPGYAFRRSSLKNRPSTLEGKGGGSAPAAPDPWQTAAATTQSNQQTAAFNKVINSNNYSNPFGSQNTTQTGADPFTGAPIYSTTLSANPQLQNQLNSLLTQTGNASGNTNNALSGLYGLNGQYNNLAGQFQNLNSGISGLNPAYDQLRSGLSSLGDQYGTLYNQYGSLGNQLNQGQAAAAQKQGQDAAYKAQTQYLDPQFSQQGESLQASLANSGLTPGSEAYNNAMTNFNNTKQQAYSNAQNQAIMTGSQLGAQNLQNQIAGINTQAGLLGQQGSTINDLANSYGQQASLLGSQAGLFGLQAGNLQGLGQAYGSQSGLMGQIASIGNQPYSQLGSIASLIPGYSGTGQSSAAPANIGQYLQNQYQSQLAGYNADQASANQTTSTVGTIGAAAAIALGF